MKDDGPHGAARNGKYKYGCKIFDDIASGMYTPEQVALIIEAMNRTQLEMCRDIERKRRGIGKDDTVEDRWITDNKREGSL